MNCKLSTLGRVSVKVANSKGLQCDVVCKELKWKMNGEAFNADMMVLDLGTYDVVLGVQWLATLGDILWNFMKLAMKFIVCDKEVMLFRAGSPELTTVDGDAMARLLQKHDEVHEVQLCSIWMDFAPSHKGPIQVESNNCERVKQTCNPWGNTWLHKLQMLL